MKLLLPTNIDLDPALPSQVTAHRYDPTKPIPASHHDAEFLVAWGQPSASALQSFVDDLPNLRWIQSLAAGPDALLRAGFSDDVVICSGIGLHDHPVAEHALTLTLAGLARLDRMIDAQREHRWDGSLGGVRPLRTLERLTTLREAHVTIWGLGSIGTRFADYARTLGAHVTGVARTAGVRDGIEVVAEDGLDAVLRETDVLVMILPSTPDTRHALNATRLALLPQRAWVVNVGRGSTVDEDALVAALTSGSIAGAALDVTETEPLPAASPLWSAPNLIISPHAAGGRPIGADQLISENVTALLEGRELRNVASRP